MFCFAILLMLFVSISLFCGVSVVESNEALIFNANRKTFDEVTETSDQYFTACAAASEDELQFNETKSIAKNCLFLKQDISAEKDMPLVKCKDFYKPSTFFSEMGKRFEIGYEVYFDKKALKGKGLANVSVSRYISTSTYITRMKAKHKPINKLWKFLPSSIPFMRSKSQNDEESVYDSDSEKSVQTYSSDTESESDTEIKKDLEKTLGLNWIRIFYFHFDIKQGGPTKIVYSKDLGELNTEFECKEYTIDGALHENINFQSIYKHENQTKLFDKLPAFPEIPTENCRHEFGCLKRHQLIPHYYYHSFASKIITCSAVNTLPVWESISDGILKKIDQYLYVISQIYGPDISITTGVTDVLSYPKYSRFNSFPRKLFMDFANKKVPVPSIIYKIVKYTKQLENFHVIIVIHNDPVTKEINHICPLDLENKYFYKQFIASWKFVENKIAKSGRSYPCPMRAEVLDRLKVYRRRSNDDYYTTLTLDEFWPVRTVEDQVSTIERYMKKFFGAA